MKTSNKATFGGLTAALSTVLMHFIDMAPVVQQMPPDVHAAVEFIVSGGLVWAVVYFVRNKEE